MKKISTFPSLLISTLGAFGLMTCVATAAVVDSDGDGINDYRESRDGTNPNDANSFNPLSTGLIIYYPFINSFNDESGNENHATRNGAVFAPDMFNATNSAVQVSRFDGFKSTKNVGVTGNSDFSVSFWMKPTQNPVPPAAAVLGWGAIPGSPGKVTSFYYRPAEAAGNLHIDENYVGARGQSSSGDLTGNWNQITYSYSGSNRLFSIYVNGVPQTNNVSHFNMNLHDLVNGKLYVGGVSKTGDFPPDEFGDRGLDGFLDNIRIYNRALSAAEISS